MAVKYFSGVHTQPPTHTPTFPPSHTHPHTHGTTWTYREAAVSFFPPKTSHGLKQSSCVCAFVRFWGVWRMCASLLTTKPNTQVKSEPLLFASVALIGLNILFFSSNETFPHAARPGWPGSSSSLWLTSGETRDALGVFSTRPEAWRWLC